MAIINLRNGNKEKKDEVIYNISQLRASDFNTLNIMVGSHVQITTFKYRIMFFYVSRRSNTFNDTPVELAVNHE